MPLPTATALFPEKLDQAKVFLPHSTAEACEATYASLHRLSCFFLICVAGKSTSSDIELVTTFSGETNWINITTGLLVGMTVVSNRSNRRERLLLIMPDGRPR